MIKIPVRDVARICHEANRALCESAGDKSQVHWDIAPSNIKASAIQGVLARLNHPEWTPEDMHNNWMKFKKEDGWVYGTVKDTVQKTHPSLVPYSHLPDREKFKDKLFSTIVQCVVENFKVD